MIRRYITLPIIQRLLAFIQRSHFNRFITGFMAILALSGALYLFVTYIAHPTFVRVIPSSFYLSFYSVEVTDAQIGTYPKLKLCRSTPFGDVHIDATRTFIRYKGEQGDEVKEYTFDANVTDARQKCTVVDLKEQPQEVGSYEVYTLYSFKIDGIEKRGNYTSNRYEMRDTVSSIQAEIDALKKRIEDLERQRFVLQSDTTIFVPQQPVTKQPTPQPQTPPQAEPGLLNKIIKGVN